MLISNDSGFEAGPEVRLKNVSMIIKYITLCFMLERMVVVVVRVP